MRVVSSTRVIVTIMSILLRHASTSSATAFVPSSLIVMHSTIMKKTAPAAATRFMVSCSNGAGLLYFGSSEGYNNNAAATRMNSNRLYLSMDAGQSRQRCLFSSLVALNSYNSGCSADETRCILPTNYPKNSSRSKTGKRDRVILFSTTTTSSSNHDKNELDYIPIDTKSAMHKASNKKKKKKKKTKDILRVDRILSNRGIGSRSETHRIIKDKRITMIDPQTQQHVLVKGPTIRLPADTTFYIDRKHELPGPIPEVLIFHKPKFVLSETMDRSSAHYNQLQEDEEGRKHVYMFLEERYQKKKNSGLHPVGRLDYDSSGLLLFSSDGSLTQRLLHPRHAVEKEYVATVEGVADLDSIKKVEEELRKELEEGVETTEGTHTATLLEVVPLEVQKNKEKSKFSGAAEGDDESINDDDESNSSKEEIVLADVRLIVQEGKYRMVRRMLANCGYPVVELKRIRHGMIKLDDLEVGTFREATDKELEWIESLMA